MKHNIFRMIMIVVAIGSATSAAIAGDNPAITSTVQPASTGCPYPDPRQYCVKDNALSSEGTVKDGQVCRRKTSTAIRVSGEDADLASKQPLIWMPLKEDAKGKW